MRSNKRFKRIICVLTAALFSAAILSSCGLSNEAEEESKAASYDEIFTIGIMVPDSGEYSYYSIGTELIMEKIAESFFEETGVYLQYYIAEDYDGSGSEAADIVEELVTEKEAKIIIAAHGDENVLSVCAACERLGVLCIAADCDLDSWLSSGPYDNSFCVSYSTQSRLYALASNWNEISDAPVVGVLIASGNDADDILDIYDDIAYDTGATVIDPGRYTEGQTDYESIISAFETSGCEIITGIMNADDFAVFMEQADEEEYYPEIIAVADACLFERDMLSLYGLGDGLYTDVSWCVSCGSDEGFLISSQDIEDIIKENYGVSAPQSAGLFAAAVQTALDAAIRSGIFETETADEDDGSQTAQALITAAKETDLETVLGEVSFDEDGACLVSTALGFWSYDADSDSCTFTVTEDESEDTEDE